jgi:rRNA maturation endonuclease Nob1
MKKCVWQYCPHEYWLWETGCGTSIPVYLGYSKRVVENFEFCPECGLQIEIKE